jgi:hypothetical protein
MKYQSRMSKIRRKNKIFAASCFGNCCGICGYSKCLKALEFHHLDPNLKDFSLSCKIFSREKLIEELSKCVCLCSNCHREVHDGLAFIDKNVRRFILPKSPEKKIIYSDCAQCNVSFAGARKFCSVKCSNLSKRKAGWPSDEDLARLIWEFPKTTLSKVFGVSDRAIAKRCSKLKIPQPEKTYWSKKRTTN